MLKGVGVLECWKEYSGSGCKRIKNAIEVMFADIKKARKT
jgi:hypothetical protein